MRIVINVEPVFLIRLQSSFGQLMIDYHRRLIDVSFALISIYHITFRVYCLIPNYTKARIYGRGRLDIYLRINVISFAIPIKFWTDDRLSQTAGVSLPLFPWFHRGVLVYFSTCQIYSIFWLSWIELLWGRIKQNIMLNQTKYCRDHPNPKPNDFQLWQTLVVYVQARPVQRPKLTV